jgi:hypothetical protein
MMRFSYRTRGISVERPSSLGNPFPMQGEATRAQVIGQYEDWLTQQLLDTSSSASREVHRLAARAWRYDPHSGAVPPAVVPLTSLSGFFQLY